MSQNTTVVGVEDLIHRGTVRDTSVGDVVKVLYSASGDRRRQESVPRPISRSRSLVRSQYDEETGTPVDRTNPSTCLDNGGEVRMVQPEEYKIDLLTCRRIDGGQPVEGWVRSLPYLKKTLFKPVHLLREIVVM